MNPSQAAIEPARSAAARAVETLAARLRAAPGRLLLLDYDGTLVPFVEAPDLARPDDDLIALLRVLARAPGTEVHVISGRSRATLESWLGALPIGLHAEHGLSYRAPGAADWVTGAGMPQDWRPAVLDLMRRFAAETPGALVEEKDAGIAWHFRAADEALGTARALALERELRTLLDGTPASILLGAKVIEVLPRGVHKGRLVPLLLSRAPGALVVAIGDDQTDEDLFAALPAEGVAVHVGPGPSRAAIRLDGVPDVRALLRGIAAMPAR